MKEEPFHSQARDLPLPAASACSFVYDGDNTVLDQKWDSGTSTWSNHRQYVTPFLDQNLSMTETSTGTDYYHTQDGLGSVRNIIDSSGTVKNTYAYTAFGEDYGTPTENVAQRYGYAGRGKLAMSGNLFYRNRGGYNPGIGRFSNRNPWGYPDHRMSLYDAMAQNPVYYTEPFSSLVTPDESRTAGTKWEYFLQMIEMSIRTSPRYAIAAFAVAEQAQREIDTANPYNDPDANNAYLHCLGSCRATVLMGRGKAEAAQDVHERYERDICEGVMDEKNNEIGNGFGELIRALPKESRSGWCEELCKEAMRDDSLIKSPKSSKIADECCDRRIEALERDRMERELIRMGGGDFH